MQHSIQTHMLISRASRPLVFGVRLASRWKRYDVQQNSKWIKTQLIHMGPAYVKMGQMVASRGDLFPDDIVKELSSLRDDVPPCPFTDVKEMVESELSSSLENLFVEFSHESISSASIGQIHIATLKQHPNTPIAIKVQRPNIVDEFKLDMESILFFARIAKSIMPHNKELYDLYNVLSQSRRFIENELDFCKERENITSMRSAFKNDAEIVIPRVVKSISTKRVLALEYIPSNKFDTVVDSSHANRVTRRLVKSVVNGALRHGVIHGDLHAGNLGICSDNRIVVYDFGLILSVDPTVVRTLLNAVLTNNVDMLFDAMVSARLVHIDDPVIGTIQLKRMISYVIEYILSLDFDRFFKHISNDVTLNSGRLCFHVDSKLFLMSRTMTLLEGTCVSIDKSFMYTDVIADIMLDSQNMDFIDVDMVLTKGLVDIQRWISPTTTTNDKNKESDDLLYFSSKHNNDVSQSIANQPIVWILTAYTLLHHFVC